jgi:hypothetical protein
LNDELMARSDQLSRKADNMIPGVAVTMGGREWTIPPLTLGQLRQLMPKIRQLSEVGTEIGETQISVLVEIVAAALQRNYPQVTADMAEHLLDLGNAGPVLNAVLSGSGLSPRSRPLGKAEAPGTVSGATAEHQMVDGEPSTASSPPSADIAIP